MGERANSSPANAGGTGQSKVESSDGTTARQVLLREARTAANQQLSRLTKIDDAAVRTARLTFLITGILAGGSQFSRFPNLGILGVLGTGSLVAALFGSLYVYGTSRLFIGSGPAELGIEYEEPSSVENACIEVIKRYEGGIRKNWGTLYANGFILAVSRVLLALATVFLVVGIAHAM